MMINLSKIVKGCKDKDKRSQYHLYELYSPKLFAICLRYTDNRDDAHDVLQEAFIRIFEKIDQVKDFELLEGWLRKVTVSTAINFYHQKKRHNNTSDLGAIMFKMADESSDILSSLNSGDLMKLIGTLPAGYKIVFNMFAIEGYSHKEIADLLHVTEGTSKSQLNHARLWLKNLIIKKSIKSGIPPEVTEGEDLLPTINTK